MNRGFTFKLAWMNIINYRKFYLPYFLASTGIIAMFYIICFLAMYENIRITHGADTLMIFMRLGAVVLGIFSLVFVFYINSFLMKQRTKQIGLYNILGMEKFHIGKILAAESFVVSIASIITGLLCGVLFSKLVHLILCRFFGDEPPFGIAISWPAAGITAILFGTLFFAVLLWHLMRLRLSNPIELLYGAQRGEREPKTNGLIALLGVICLGGGYFIANVIESPLSAIFVFFVAVILVIIGTYCLFTAGSIAALKALRSNKAIYYRPGNFTAISGLIYRMKQNAVGLANICILSTMVLVMISGTVSLYAGMNDVINSIVPADLCVQVQYREGEQLNEKKLERLTKEAIVSEGGEIVDFQSARYFSFVTTTDEDGEIFQLSGVDEWSNPTVTCFALVTEEMYAELTGMDLELEEDEVAAYCRGRQLPESFNLGGKVLVKTYDLHDFPKEVALGELMCDINYLVVANEQIYKEFYQLQADVYGEAASNYEYQLAVNLGNYDEIETACRDAVYAVCSEENLGQYASLSVEDRGIIENAFFSLIGGFLFLGVFLGIVFTFAAALIIYYKQISEGYYDKDKFEIMQKVGMSKAEVKQTIKRQVLFVFFIPLIMAGVHVIAAFKMINKLLLIFSMNNVQLFAICSIVTFLCFALIYAFVYAVTAREYYKIVG